MQRFHTGAVTDVFSSDVAAAAPVMRGFGMRGAELRTIDGVHVLEKDKDAIQSAIRVLHDNDLEVMAIATRF